MSSHHRRDKFANLDNTGFGPNSSVEGGRLTNKDGTTNLRKTGLPFWERISVFHTLIRMKRSHFLLCILVFYTAINLFFAFIYFVIGTDHLMGTETASSWYEKFMEAFFFSSQTLTTVGYGHVAPTGMLTNFVASTESLLGILSFAVVTGLIYGRFSRPRAYLKFSDHILVAPFKEGKALMMRMATYKNNYLTDAEAVMTVALHVPENDGVVTRFYQLPLQISRINSLAISWTLVHPMDENSPLYNFTESDFKENRAEIIVAVKAFDDHFSNLVQQRTSYTSSELVYGAKFLPVFHRAGNGMYTVLELQKVNAYEKITLPGMQVDADGSISVAVNS